MCGWLLSNHTLVGILPGLLPMQPPIAAGFILSGVGLLLASRRQFRGVAVCAGALGLIAIAVLHDQYSHGSPILRSILDRFSAPSLAAVVGSRLSSPCLALISISLLLLSSPKTARWRSGGLGLCGSLIVSLSLGIDTGYVLGLAGPQFVPTIPQISPVVAGTFLAASCSILLLAIHRESKDAAELMFGWLPVFAGVASVGITFYLWLVFSAEVRRFPRAFPDIPHDRFSTLLVAGGLALSTLIVATLVFALRLRLRTQELELAVQRHTSLASLVAMSRDFIALANLDGEITYLNAAAKALVGLEDAAPEGPVTMYDLFAPDAIQTVRNEVLPALLKNGWVRIESQLRHFRTGQTIPVDIEGIVIKDSHGTAMALGTVTRDLTQQRAAEIQRARLEMQLAQAQKMEALGRLTGGIAHDFNNSLTVILGYASLLESSDRLMAQDRKAISALKEAGTNSRSLVRQLMGFSRQQVIAPQLLNLNQVLLDSEPLLARLLGEDIELRLLPDPGLWGVLLDPSQVNQVVMNLAANARDAMPDGGQLTLQTANTVIDANYAQQDPEARPGEYVVLSVSDTGIGMTSETMARIFEPFFTTKENSRGTGLGLATVYGIVRQNQGFINVHSELQHGTEFQLHFPRSARDAENPAKRADDRPAPAPRRGVILLVEDDDLVRKVTAEVLQVLGYTTAVAATARAALEICSNAQTSLDLIISDVILPEMKGTELRNRIVTLRPGVPVLFVSGYTSDVIGRDGVLQPGVHFLQKPFSMEDLDTKIHSILRQNGDRAAGAPDG